MPLLARPLRLHDVEDAEKLCASVFHDWRRRRTAYLNENEVEDLLSYLIGVAWEAAQKFDPERAKGKPFSHVVVTLLHFRIVSWFRQRFGSTRYRTLPTFVPHNPELDARVDNAEYDFPSVNLAALSEPARATLVEVAAPLAFGETTLDELVGTDAGKTRRRQNIKDRLAQLRDEVTAQGVEPPSTSAEWSRRRAAKRHEVAAAAEQRSRLRSARMNELLDEARRMPDASIRFARSLSQVSTPERLIALRQRVRTKHRGELLRLHAAINERFGTTGTTDDYVNVFYAAAEMALMERVARNELPTQDQATLRRLWEHLLHAS